MSTNEPHPLAPLPTIPLSVQAQHYNIHSRENIVQVHGRLVGVYFRISTNPRVKPLIILWDWIAGVEVARLELQPEAECSLTFLSEEYFIVTQRAHARTGALIPNYQYYQLGHLDIYRVPFKSVEIPSQKAFHIARYMLPDLRGEYDWMRMEISSYPAPMMSEYPLATPKIYEIDPKKRFVHLHICASEEDEEGFGVEVASGLLYFQVGTLLDSLGRISTQSTEQSNPTSISWSEWGNLTTWVSGPPDCHLSRFVWGERQVFLSRNKAEGGGEHTYRAQPYILDFNARANKPVVGLTPGVGRESLEPIQVAGNDFRFTAPRNNNYRTRVEKAAFQMALRPNKLFTTTRFTLRGAYKTLQSNQLIDDNLSQLREDPVSDSLLTAMIDDEHLILHICKYPSLAMAGILVYNIGEKAQNGSSCFIYN